MTALMQAVRAEVAKVFTTRMWWILAIIMVVYVGFVALAVGFGLGFTMKEAMDSGFPLPIEIDAAATTYSSAVTIGYVFAVLIGALSATGEYRHQTVTPMFLAVPKREQALVAKLAVQSVLGMFYGILAFIGTVALGAIGLSIAGVDAGLGQASTWLVILRGVLAMGLWAAIGVGVGALVRNQVAAIVIVVAFTQFVEPILRTGSLIHPVAGTIGQFLPGGASDALVGASIYSFMMMATSNHLLWWAGGLVLVAYALVATVGGYFTSWRKDVT